MVPARTSTPPRRRIALGLTAVVITLLDVSCADGQAEPSDGDAAASETPTAAEALAGEIRALSTRIDATQQRLAALTPERIEDLQALRHRLAARATTSAGGAPVSYGFDVAGGGCGSGNDNDLEHFIRLESGRWGGIEIVRCER